MRIWRVTWTNKMKTTMMSMAVNMINKWEKPALHKMEFKSLQRRDERRRRKRRRESQLSSRIQV